VNRFIGAHLLLVAFLLCMGLSCGRRGELVPREQARPLPVRDLFVRASDRGITVSWKVPESNSDGSPLIPLRGYRVQRRVGEGRFVDLGFERAPFGFWEIEEMSLLDTDVEINTIYQYRVAAVNVLRGMSDPSISATVRMAGDASPGRSAPGSGTEHPAAGEPLPEISLTGTRAERGPGGRVYLWWDNPVAADAMGIAYEVFRFGRDEARSMRGTVTVPFFVDDDAGAATSYHVRVVDPRAPGAFRGAADIPVGGSVRSRDGDGLRLEQ